jgi:hypothetical protein
MLSSISLIETREPETDGGTPPFFFWQVLWQRCKIFHFLETGFSQDCEVWTEVLSMPAAGGRGTYQPVNHVVFNEYLLHTRSAFNAIRHRRVTYDTQDRQDQHT